MNRTIRFMVIMLIIGIGMSACSKSENTNVFIPMDDLVVSDDFNWQTARNVDINLEVQANDGAPVSNVVFELFDANPREDGKVIGKGATGTDGKFRTVISIPSNVAKVWAVGFMTTEELSIVGNTVSKLYGGVMNTIKGGEGFFKPQSKAWSYLPGITYNSNGVPSGMTNDVISASFLQRINATLPESRSVPAYHPDYLNTANQTNIKIIEHANVWITFVTEGAGYRNALGFHTYNTATPPAAATDVSTKTLVLPNASLNGSGGGLASGNKVFLGEYFPGTTIGWFLAADGFQSGSNVSTTVPLYYSTPALNTIESNPAKRQHSILVYDDFTDRLLIGFEDLPRSAGGSDDDFNDVVFYVTVSPIEAVDIDDVPPIDTPIDTDGDGINDRFDDYPNDPELAFNNYTFGENNWGSLSFEDLWPAKGDYDFNDMVIDYNYNQITKAGNLVKKVEMNFKLRAVGARYSNGFAVQLPFVSSNMINITPTNPQLFNHETDGSKSVLRFFNNAFDLIPQQPTFINTEPGVTYYQPVTFGVTFKLNTPVSATALAWQPPYNPFIFVRGVRSHEVHLANYAPTSKMNTALFGTGDDSSNAAQNRYYKTANNLPWGVNIASSWDYPVERAQTTRAYLMFKNWAQSSGTSYPDWYMDKPGYRDEQYIYQTP
ncbi:MAG: hypothetical protein CVU48_04760 [Candidatus Cloacimonetes bacterium HGW-Cloacimonetes-1]|nr:MAG: hypothetical protein CVU48_04760 [Candidatus Cloacimonetes bacterium HGW-Cloacimonetes-1]